MRSASQLYKTLRAQTGSYYEIRVVRGAVTYGMDKLKSIHIKQALFEDNGPQIGGVHSTQCDVKLIEESSNWPRMASFEVDMRLSSEDDTQKSEWISLGIFYTDERKDDKHGNLDITAFDGMLLLEQTWTDKVQNLPTSWPITARQVADLLVEATGIEIDQRSIIDNTTYYIGLDTTSTARDVYKSIAAGCGGNWYMTAEGKLRLVPLFAQPTIGLVAIAGIAIAGITVVGDDESDYDIAYVGMAANNLDISTPLAAITGIEIQAPDGTTAFAGARTGYVVKATCAFADTSIAQLCLSKIAGYQYIPFEVSRARIDPIAEIGDSVFIAEEMFPIITADWNIAPKITADLSAPFEEEVDHEYQTMSESAKALKSAINYTNGQIEQTRSYIQQTATSIQQGVAASYVSNAALNTALLAYSPTEDIANRYYNKNEVDSQSDALASEIALTESNLTIAFSQLQTDTNNAFSAMSYYIRYENGVIIIGQTDSPTSIRISNSQIGIYYNDTVISYWNQDKQFTPSQLQIPTGGKFTLGSILFQPRSSGNMSLMWVG